MKSGILLFSGVILITGIISAQGQPQAAGKVIDDARALAASEGKSVMIVFHASWCGWCKKFEASVNDPSCKDFFNKHFVISYLDILERGDKKNLENPGAEEIFNKYGGNGGGIPFFLIFDGKGTLLADSRVKTAGAGVDKPPQNIGCPATNEEITAFINILEKATRISSKDKTAIKERFIKNKS